MYKTSSKYRQGFKERHLVGIGAKPVGQKPKYVPINFNSPTESIVWTPPPSQHGPKVIKKADIIPIEPSTAQDKKIKSKNSKHHAPRQTFHKLPAEPWTLNKVESDLARKLKLALGISVK